MECWDRHQNQNWDHIDLTIFVGCQSKSNSLCHLENESVATTRYHVPHTYPWEWWASCTQVFDNKSRSHQPWDPRVGPLAPPLSSILRVRSICCPILTKTKCPLKPPFFSSIMQFGKLFDHEMFLFLMKRCFKLTYKNTLVKVNFTSTHQLGIIWHKTSWKVGFQKCRFQHKFESTVSSHIILWGGWKTVIKQKLN